MPLLLRQHTIACSNRGQYDARHLEYTWLTMRWYYKRIVADLSSRIRYLSGYFTLKAQFAPSVSSYTNIPCGLDAFWRIVALSGLVHVEYFEAK